EGIGFLGVIRDLTERQRLQGRLIQADKLASLGLLTGTFAAWIPTVSLQEPSPISTRLLQPTGPNSAAKCLRSERSTAKIRLRPSFLRCPEQAPRSTRICISRFHERRKTLLERACGVPLLLGSGVDRAHPVLPTIPAGTGDLYFRKPGTPGAG